MRSSSGVLRTRLSEGYKTGPIATCLAVALVYAVFFLWAGVAAEVVSAKEIEALTAKARDLYAAGKYRAAVPVCRDLLSKTELIAGPDHPLVSRALNNLALVLQETRSYPEAVGLFERALAIDEKHIGPDHLGIVRSLTNLALALQEQGLIDRSVILFERALRITENALGREHPAVAVAIASLAGAKTDQKKYIEALSLIHN